MSAVAGRVSVAVAADRVLTARLADRCSFSLRGRELTGWPRPPARYLTLLLVLAPNHQLTREQACAQLFPDVPTNRAVRLLSKATSQARQVLGPDVLIAEGAALRLTTPVQTDLDEGLAALRSALRLPPGLPRRNRLAALLVEVGEIAAGEAEIAGLAAARRELAGVVAEARLALGQEEQQATGSLDSLAAAFATDHTDERAAIALIEAYLDRGQRSAALRTYRACRFALARQLGVEPSAVLEQVIAPLSAARLPGPEVVGRDRERDRVRDVVEAAAVGDGQALLVTGPAGSGKTALLHAVAAGLRRGGWLVLFGAAATGDELSPYGALRSALLPVLADTERALPTSIRALLHPRSASSEWPMTVLADDLGRVLDRMCADTPATLVLDDVHWSDPALPELVGRMTAPGRERGWSVLLAARSDEPGRPVPVLPAHVHLLELDPLRKQDAVSLARRTLARSSVAESRLDTLADAVAELSRGNPFFLLEVARQVGSGGPLPAFDRPGSVPQRIVELLDRRLSACSADARAVLAAIAVAGRDARHQVLAAVVAHIARVDVERVMEELLDAQLLTRARDGVRLIHPLLRDAAVARLNPLRLANLHDQVAAALEAVETDSLQSVAAHRIAAFRAARLPDYAPAAVAAGVAAGRAARAVLADDAAMGLLAAALEAFDSVPAAGRVPLRATACAGWLQVGHIRTDRLQLDQAEDAYRRSIRLAASDEEYAAGYSAFGGVAYKRGRLAESERRYRAGLELLTGVGGWAGARLTADIAWVQYRQGRGDDAAARLRVAADEFIASRDQASAARCLDLQAVVLHGRGRLAEALITSDKAMALGDQVADPRLTPILAAHRSGILRDSDRIHDAAAEARRALVAAQTVGDRYLETVALWSLADALDRVGDLTGALAARQSEAAVLRELGNPVNLAICLGHQATLLHRLGQRAAAATAAGQARSLAEQTADPQFRTTLEQRLASLLG